MDPPNGNPVEPSEPLKQTPAEAKPEANPQTEILPGDSATTQAEKVERSKALNGLAAHDASDFEQSPAKRQKRDHDNALTASEPTDRRKGVAPIKAEYLIDMSRTADPEAPTHDDDAAEGAKSSEQKPAAGRGGKKTEGGQNKARTYGSSRDAIELCKARDHANEFDAITCKFGDKCRMEHDIRKYLKEGKREDLSTFDSKCPVKQSSGSCPAGWRCRFAGSHSREIEREDGRKELIDESGQEKADEDEKAEERKTQSDKLKKEERDRKLKGMSAEEQRKFLEREADAERKKGMKRRTMKA